MSQLKTAIVTWISYQNFGTYLQAYALQQAVQRLGYDCTILSDSNIVSRFFPPTLKSRTKDLINLIKQFFFKKGIDQKAIKKSYTDFAESYLSIDTTWKDATDLNQRYDVFICGSDQIWSPVVPFDAYYYLDFTTKKKVAYAPSIGSFTYPQEKISLVKPYLEKFTSLSIREEQGAQIIREQFGLPCQAVLDPTLLLDQSDWEQFTSPHTGNDYILCYLLTFNETYWNFVRNFANAKGMLLKAFIVDVRDNNYVDEALHVGPQGFLNAIKNATYFFTDSFHGSVFAIHFEKCFVTFKRFKDNSANNQNSRIINLFEKLGLSERFISENDLYKVQNLSAIDFITIKQCLYEERLKSLNYLTEALKK